MKRVKEESKSRTLWDKYVKSLLIAFLRFYKLVISPFLPPSCRFSPTCSQYAVEAIGRYGALRGSGLALAQIAALSSVQRRAATIQ